MSVIGSWKSKSPDINEGLASVEGRSVFGLKISDRRSAVRLASVEHESRKI
jgi:hypothetical protein